MAQVADLFNSSLFLFSSFPRNDGENTDYPAQQRNSLILNDQINVISLVYEERIVAQVRLSSSEMYFFGLLYEAFPAYVADKDIHLTSAFVRKRVVPELRRKMLLFAPHLYLLRIKEVGYVLLSSVAP